MATDGIVIKISGDPKDLEKAVQDVKKLFNEVGKDAKGAASTSQLAWASFIGNFASATVQSAINSVQEAIGAVFGKIKDGVKDAIEADSALSKFNLALANTGKFTKAGSDDFAAFADKLEKTANISEEATLKAGALLQSLGNLDQQGLKRATQAAADLSAAIGVDFDTAAGILGKAAQGNVEALKKYGVQVEDTGDKAKDFNSALTAIEGRFSGSAVNSINTFAGAVKFAGNSFDDLFKELGKSVTDTPALKGLAQGVGQIFQDLKKLIEENRAGLVAFVTNGVDLFIDGIGSAGKAVSFFFTLKQGFSDFIAFLSDAFISAIQSYNEFGLGIVEGKKKIEEFFGASTAGSEAAIAGFKVYIDAAQATRDEIKAASFEENRINDERIAAIDNFTTKAVETLRTRVDAAKAAGEEETTGYLEQANARALIAQEADAKRLEEIRAYQAQTLADAQGVLDASVIAEAKTQSDKLINEQKYSEARKALLKTREQTEKDSIFYVKSFEESTQKERLANVKSTLGSLASLQSSSSAELFAIGKASAVATATIDGISAVQKALASAPPPFNFILATLVGVATAANIGKIASQPAPQGMAQGGLVTGGIPGVDSVPIVAQQGEIVAPVNSFDDVVEGTARQRGFVKGDENQSLIAAIQDLKNSLSGGGSVSLQVGTLIADDNGINELASKLRDAVQFRGAQLA